MHLLIGPGLMAGAMDHPLGTRRTSRDGDGQGDGHGDGAGDGASLRALPLHDGSAEGQARAAIDLAAVDWPAVKSVHISVAQADHVAWVLDTLVELTRQPLTVFVHSTLAPHEARSLLSAAPETWRLFEAPLSAGPQGARAGAMTVLLAGPATNRDEDRLLASLADRVYRLAGYGQPALVKLVNNTLAAYNLAATANLLALAANQGVPPRELVAAIGVSSGRGWLHDRLGEVQYEDLLEDVELLASELGPLPPVDLHEELEPAILQARALLGHRAAG